MTITLATRPYMITRTRDQYLLRGRRGAVYATMRDPRQPAYLYLRSVSRVDPLGPLMLLESSGTLYVDLRDWRPAQPLCVIDEIPWECVAVIPA